MGLDEENFFFVEGGEPQVKTVAPNGIADGVRVFYQKMLCKKLRFTGAEEILDYKIILRFLRPILVYKTRAPCSYPFLS